MRKSLIYCLMLVLQAPFFVFSQNSNLSAQQLQKLVAPIALYPDPLLAQMLPASTYPLEIVEAARMIKTDKDSSMIDSQNWDPSVKAVAHYPSVLQMMNSKLDWTQQLGQAVLTQQADVLAAIQSLRQQAQKAGNLKSTSQQNVQTSSNNISIVPSDPQVIYVPTYNPSVVYTDPDPLYGFGAGFMMGAWMSMGFAWGGAWGGGYIVNNYNWNNVNANNLNNDAKNWENNHPNATQDAKNDVNNWKDNHPNSAWSHDDSKGTPFGGGNNSNDYSKPGSLFSKQDAEAAQKNNYQNFENQMKNADSARPDSGGDDRASRGDMGGGRDFGNTSGRDGMNPMVDNRASMFSGRGADQSMMDSDRGFDSRGGGGFGGFDRGGGGFGGFRGGGFGGGRR